MAEDDDAHLARIKERLRKDHPDPAMRQDLDWHAYVRSLMPDGGRDEAQVERIAAALAREPG